MPDRGVGRRGEAPGSTRTSTAALMIRPWRACVACGVRFGALTPYHTVCLACLNLAAPAVLPTALHLAGQW